MIVKLPFGPDHRAVDLRGFRVRPLQPSGSRGKHDPADLVAAALDHPIDGDPLNRIAGRCRTAVVVVPDSTRSCELDRVLPVLVGRLGKAGVPEGDITLVVACGTHPVEGDAALRAHLGPLPGGVKVIQHEARNGSALAAAGRLAEGLEIRLNRVVLEAELLITIGAVKHHYFAGFGGGPKMIFPGVSGYEEIQSNHSLVLELAHDPPRRAVGCEPGVLVGNPVADQIARAAALRPPDLALCLVPGVDGRVVDAFAGGWERAWAAAVEQVRDRFEVDHERFDLVVACGGGAPYDATLIQAHKGLDAACRFLRPGGEALFVSGMTGGIGSGDMAPYLADPRPEVILDLLAAKWVQYGHTVLRIVEKTTQNRVHLVSDLDPGLAQRLGFVTATSSDEVVEQWREHYEGATIGVMAGPAVYPRQE